MNIHRGVIAGLHGSWGSGLAMLTFEDGTSVPCDNGQTVRSLESAFGNVIGNAYNIRADGGHVGKEVFHEFDDFGLTLGWFVPVDEASPELIEAYESGGAT